MIKHSIKYKNYFTRKDLNIIHNVSMDLLENTGVKIVHKKAKKIFQENGAKVEGDIVYLPRNVVENAIDKAPSQFTLYARNPDNNVVIGNNNSVLAPGFGAPFVRDLDNGRRDSTFKDYVNFTKLASSSKHFDVLGGVLVEPNDIDNNVRHAKMFYTGAKYSDKCLMGSSMGRKKAHDCLEMARILFAEDEIIRDRSVVISLINTNSPLQYDYRMLDSLIEHAKHNQALIITSGVMGGSTGPMSTTGVLVLQNAEILTGIVLAQLISPGTPVVYGFSASITDMRQGNLVIGSSEYVKLIGAGAHLSRYYNLPSRSGGTLTDSLMVDTQAGYEAMMVFMSTINNGVNFVLHSAGILDSFMTMSYEKFVIDNEIIAMVSNIHSRMEINKDSIPIKVINSVGHGGHYLAEAHTLQHMKDYRMSELSNRDVYISEDSLNSIGKRANNSWKNIIENFESPYLDPNIDKKLINYVNEL